MKQKNLFKGKRTDNKEFTIGALIVDENHQCSIIEYANHGTDTYFWNDVIPDSVSKFVKNDKNGSPIFEGDKFKFKFLRELNNPIELIGSFDWCQDELRYEIDIWNHEEYVCLSYVDHGVMFDFELLP